MTSSNNVRDVLYNTDDVLTFIVRGKEIKCLLLGTLISTSPDQL